MRSLEYLPSFRTSSIVEDDKDFSVLLPDVVTIAGEVDAQLKEQILLHGSGCREAGEKQVNPFLEDYARWAIHLDV